MTNIQIFQKPIFERQCLNFHANQFLKTKFFLKIHKFLSNLLNSEYRKSIFEFLKTFSITLESYYFYTGKCGDILEYRNLSALLHT